MARGRCAEIARRLRGDCEWAWRPTESKFISLQAFTRHSASPPPLHPTPQAFKDVGNRQLLFHGSRLSNWAGILGSGLRIAPPEAPATGYMFGKGVYFADMSSKSANYCFATKEHPVRQLDVKSPYGILTLYIGCSHGLLTWASHMAGGCVAAVRGGVGRGVRET